MSHHCPSCGKTFQDHTSVARHMSQPRSGCNTWLEDLINSTTLSNEDHPMDSADGSDVEPFQGLSDNFYDFGDFVHGGGSERERNSELTGEDGYTFLGLIHQKTNLYYPFSTWLLRSGLSMGKIDSFLSLEMIKDLPLSFRSAKELRGRAEMLPSGPHWQSRSPVVLYWPAIFNHPVYTTTEKKCRVFTEWMTENDAWDMQSAIPSGATLLGTILSSDKTNITSLTGDPLLPVPKFIHKKKRMRGMLEDRLVHQCLDIVLEPLKQAARSGIMLLDPIGHNPFQHEPRTKSTTLAQLAVAKSCADPNDVEKPFWWDWLLAEPSHFFTPESLHHIHKQFYDHDVKWLICAVGESEIDFRFSVLQPMTGYRHFLTGRLPTDVLAAVRALMQFRYLVQLPHVDEENLKRISSTLAEFHAKKDAIIAAGVRRGSGNRVINKWYIPKLELMQSIIASIRNSGIIGQWSADVTEHAHITEVKDPARSTNNNNYNPQICRYLDRAEKCRRFELATGILDCEESVGKLGDLDPDDEDTDVDDADRTALHLVYDPSIQNITVDEATIKFALPDLQPAIADFLQWEATYGHAHVHAIGGPRRAGPTAILPFDKIQVWFKIRVQEMELYDAHAVRSAQMLNCAPPNNPWTLGHYDTSIFKTDASHTWPNSGLSGHTVAQIRLIMRPIGKSSTRWLWKDQFLTYVQRFDISNDRDPTTQLHLLKRAKHSNGNRMGDVIPVSQMRAPINLILRFGAIADVRLTAYNSMEHAAEFWLNEFWDKTTFFVLSR
ncbi:uncharacterized protein HD556DRAFT_1434027 [Suillus plorans]|uniref:C2H2-type domain-containing protein n=1 Tax=Suillus plorans TaxID=116603 RepID=A0A9P7AFU0_9AGAM|nr:uncharacterized protein HD556DRAFT_1434027 [Suillus plorans]KAG1788469.1 hypothetical protein HD556DRAFT_1434027 [Suillus plorans]